MEGDNSSGFQTPNIYIYFFPVDDYEENDAEFGSASKKRRTNKTLKLKKSATSRSGYFCSLHISFMLVFFCIYSYS